MTAVTESTKRKLSLLQLAKVGHSTKMLPGLRGRAKERYNLRSLKADVNLSQSLASGFGPFQPVAFLAVLGW